MYIFMHSYGHGGYGNGGYGHGGGHGKLIRIYM